MRVGFLALQAPGLSPSQRYRVEAFLPALARRGITVQYEWALGPDDLRTFYGASGVAAKAAVAARAALRRVQSLSATADVDVVLVQREAFFLGGAWSERIAAARAPLVYDFDDAIWIRATSTANRRYAWLKNVGKIPRIVQLARTVLAGNDYLAAWARPYASRVEVLPTCVDTDLFTPAPRPRSLPVTLGWSGSPSTVDHLRLLVPVLERLQAAYGDRVAFRVMGDPSFSHPPLRLQGEAWSPEAELALLRRMDIGMMPLPDDAWTRGKCGLKGLVSMAVGAATVMSPVGVNTQIVTHGDTGLLAASEDDWFAALSTLIEDADLRRRLGEAGRQRVIDAYSVRCWAGRFGDALEQARR